MVLLVRRLGLFSLVLAMGLMATPPLTGAGVAATGTNSCNPANEITSAGYPDTGTGPFTARTDGKAVGDASLTDASGTEFDAPNSRLTWSMQETVTGNAGPDGSASPGFMNGSLTFTLTPPNLRPITFRSRCILEAGVFNTVEDDPFDPETTRPVLQGVEGEFEGTSNFIRGAVAIGTLTVWQPADGSSARFHVGLTPGPCTNEPSQPAAEMGGSGTSGITLSATHTTSGRVNCGPG